jgi:hypothetical protein
MSAPASTCRGTLDRGLDSFDRQRVGPGHDDERRIGSRVDRGLDAVDHLGLRDDGRARPVPAPLGLHLIFDMHRAGARSDQRSHRPRDVEGASESRIRIHQERQARAAGDPPHVGQHVLERRDHQIGPTKRSRRDATQKNKAAMPERLVHPRGVRVDASDDLQRPLVLHRRPEPRPRRRRAHAQTIQQPVSLRPRPGRILRNPSAI